MNKVYITDKEIKRAAVSLAENIENDKYKPDLIVAVTRGGLIPAGYISYYLDQPNVDVVKLQTYEGENQVGAGEEQEYQLRVDLQNIIKKWNPKNILFIDDLIDTGNTLKLIDVNLTAVYNYFKMIGVKRDFDWAFGVLYSVPDVEKRFMKKIYRGAIKPEGWLVFPWDTRD